MYSTTFRLPYEVAMSEKIYEFKTDKKEDIYDKFEDKTNMKI